MFHIFQCLILSTGNIFLPGFLFNLKPLFYFYILKSKSLILEDFSRNQTAYAFAEAYAYAFADVYANRKSHIATKSSLQYRLSNYTQEAYCRNSSIRYRNCYSEGTFQ